MPTCLTAVFRTYLRALRTHPSRHLEWLHISYQPLDTVIQHIYSKKLQMSQDTLPYLEPTWQNVWNISLIMTGDHDKDGNEPPLCLPEAQETKVN